MRATCERMRSVVLTLALAVSACDTQHTAAVPPQPPTPEPTLLARDEDAPGIRVRIVAVEGASGVDGTLQPGDRVRVRFELTKADATPWGIAEMVESSALLSGPTFNYQRVLAEQRDVVERAQANADGSFTYSFAARIPEHYLAPYNDTDAFGEGDGELKGRALLAGTYTVGLSFVWDYSVAGVTHHDVGEAHVDVLFGGATTLRARAVTANANCEQCHVSIRAHDGKRRDVAQCVLCHTSGAEDVNDPAQFGGTPGVSIDMRVVMHKVHDGRHLPSVNGVATDALGFVTYGNPPQPYVLVDGVTGAHDYSDVGFPAFPNRLLPMPRDFGYSSLSPSERAAEDLVRSGVTTCSACHGDPDRDGPLAAPAQGDVVYAEPSRRACGSCHDLVDFSVGFERNLQQMPPQLDDSDCFQCHAPDGAGFFAPLSVRDAHAHPLTAPQYVGATFTDFTTFPGLHVGAPVVSEAGASNGDGTLDPGERVQLTFTLTDDAGVAYPPARLAALTAVFAGPTTNANLVHKFVLPRALLSGAQPYSLRLPETLQLEFVGRSTALTGDVFTTARAPHFALQSLPTVVRVRTGSVGGASTLTVNARAPANFVDVADATGFARDDFIVLDDLQQGSEEYLRIQFVDGTRLWFSSPETPAYKAATQHDHAAGAGVREVQLATKNAATYALNASAGTITESSEFGTDAVVLVSYTTDFVVPTRYPLASNASPDLDESSGKWSGMASAGGTYRVTLCAAADLNFNANGEDNFYRYASEAVATDVLVGDADTLVPYAAIESGAACLACHQRLDYHDGAYRGFEACIACHGNAGAEDRPRYVASNAPATDGVTTSFRSLLHSIHRGRDLDAAATFTVVGSGASAYPNNFTNHGFASVGFPARPGASAHCTKCHGAANANWNDPPSRDHPSDQGTPTAVWRIACAACHDSANASAHIALETAPGGVENCAACHASGGSDDTALVHKTR